MRCSTYQRAARATKDARMSVDSVAPTTVAASPPPGRKCTAAARTSTMPTLRAVVTPMRVRPASGRRADRARGGDVGRLALDVDAGHVDGRRGEAVADAEVRVDVAP